MKKIANYLFILAILAGITACGNNADIQSEPNALTWQEQYDLGIRYLSEGNYEEAIIAFTVAIEIDPKRAPAYVGRGDAYVASGETDENLAAAQADYEKAIELDETNADAYLGLADTYIRRGEYEKALEILKQGLEKVGENQKISNKIIEMEAGNISDSSGKTRREIGFDGAGVVQYYIDYTYDAKGRRDTVSSYDGSDSLTGYAECSYDEYGHQIDGFYTHSSNHIKTINPLKNFFDSNGKEIRSDWYRWSDGSLNQYTETDYNSDGDRIEMRWYDPNGSITQRNCWEYSSPSVISGETVYHYSNGEIQGYSIHSYNSDGKATGVVDYSPDGSVTGRREFLYNDKGFRIESKSYDTDRTLRGRTTFEYNENGKKVRENTYDAVGNLIHAKSYN